MTIDLVGLGEPLAGAGVPARHLKQGRVSPREHARERSDRRISMTAVHVLSLLVGAGLLLFVNRNQWFTGDEWAFISRRGPGFAELDLFRPHNDHWTTIPLLVYWALLSTVGLSSYLPYAAVAVLAHLALAHLLWRTCLRVGVTPLFATAFVSVFIVLGAGGENLVWAFQMGFVAAIAFGLAAVLLHDHDGPFDRRDVVGWIMSIAALMSCGPALIMVAVAVLTAALRRRRLVDLVLIAAVPTTVFATWYLAEGRHAQRLPQPPGSEWGVVDWTWHGLVFAVERIVGVPQTGGVVVLALVAWWVTHPGLLRGRTAVAAATAVGAFGFYLMTAFGRSGLGLPGSTASRYVYVAAALLLPTIALIVTRAVPDGVAPAVAVVVITGLVAIHNLGLLRSSAKDEAVREQVFKDYVIDAAAAVRSGERLTWQPPNSLNPDLDTHGLREILALGRLP